MENDDLLEGLKSLDAVSERVTPTQNGNGIPVDIQNLVPSGWDADTAVFLAISVLVFGLIVFFTMAVLLFKGKKPAAVLKICALPLVIVSAIFLVVIGYSQEQIAPVLALLSAIAGYLLGNQNDNGGDQATVISTTDGAND